MTVLIFKRFYYLYGLRPTGPLYQRPAILLLLPQSATADTVAVRVVRMNWKLNDSYYWDKLVNKLGIYLNL